MIHSLGGGTGSGLGSNLTQQIYDNFRSQLIHNFTVFPSSEGFDHGLASYNTIFALNELINCSNLCIPIHNDKLFKICKDNLKIESPTFGDLNNIIARAVTDVSSAYRFSGQINTGMRKLSMGLVVYPRLHFPMISLSSLASDKDRDYLQTKTPKTIKEIFH